MLIYSQKRKKIADCAAISVERIVGGGKEGKYALVGSAELEKIFAAFESGAGSYRI